MEKKTRKRIYTLEEVGIQEKAGYVKGYFDCKTSIKLQLQEKIKELKSDSNYPHHFKGQMVDDFEWVIRQLN